MLSIEKLLSLSGLAGVGGTIVNISLLKRFLSCVAAIVAFTAISGTMAGMLLIGALYALDLSLIHHGMTSLGAGLLSCGLAITLVMLFGVLAFMRWQQLRDMPSLLSRETPFIHRAGKLAEAFIDGLMSERTER